MLRILRESFKFYYNTGRVKLYRFIENAGNNFLIDLLGFFQRFLRGYHRGQRKINFRIDNSSAYNHSVFAGHRVGTAPVYEIVHRIIS